MLVREPRQPYGVLHAKKENAMPKNSLDDKDTLNGVGPLDYDSTALDDQTGAATDDERSEDSGARDAGRAADASAAARAVREAVRSSTPRSGPSIERDIMMVVAAGYIGYFIARLAR
ncbi:hypothetical protein DTW90_33135 [Neorhizobium sp. P12A]|nr:hypothetical protein DTW90_33135 [Neorhizobium sp. P12A]